jgi:uncharacterized protein with PIN domain
MFKKRCIRCREEFNAIKLEGMTVQKNKFMQQRDWLCKKCTTKFEKWVKENGK